MVLPCQPRGRGPSSPRRVKLRGRRGAASSRGLRLRDDAAAALGGYRSYVRTGGRSGHTAAPAADEAAAARGTGWRWTAWPARLTAVVLFTAVRPTPCGRRSSCRSSPACATPAGCCGGPLACPRVAAAGVAVALRRRRPVLMLGVLLVAPWRDGADRPALQRPRLLPARRLRALPGGGHLQRPPGRGPRAGRRVRSPCSPTPCCWRSAGAASQRGRPDLGRAVRDHRLDDRVHGAAAAPVRGQAAGPGGQQGRRPGAAADRQGTARRGGAQHERHRRPGRATASTSSTPARRRPRRARRHPGHQPRGAGRDAPDAGRAPAGRRGTMRPGAGARRCRHAAPAGTAAAGGRRRTVPGARRCSPRPGWPTWTGWSRGPRARACGST